MPPKDLFNDFNNEDDFDRFINSNEITLYGVGISFIEAIALSKTLSQIIEATDAVLWEPPYDDRDYFCYIYYADRKQREIGYKALSENFAITSPIIYKTNVSIADILNDLGFDY